VRRCALLKQQRQLSYEELAFRREDSASFGTFARLPLKWSPKTSVLHQTIAALRPETWEAINQARLESAKQARLESGATVRFDSTVTKALMHEPSDSPLLCDAVRVMTRLLCRAAKLPGAPGTRWRDRRRLAKKRARAIAYSRGQDKKRLLDRDLVVATQASQAERQAAAALADSAETAVARWRAEVDHYLPLIACIISQTQRRVFDGGAVPAGEKLISLFEPHADSIVKGGRPVQYGHKLNLATGKSGLILDVVIEAGNPADAARVLPRLNRHIARTVAADRRRWRRRQPCQSRHCQGLRRRRCRLSQERRHRRCRHGQEPWGRSPSAHFPRRHRGVDLLLQTRLRRRPLHLARVAILQGLHLVGRGRRQSRAVRPPQTGVATSSRLNAAATGKITLTGTARNASHVWVAAITT
jgi:IS5 family transposase